jgi:hypothetical protein
MTLAKTKAKATTHLYKDVTCNRHLRSPYVDSTGHRGHQSVEYRAILQQPNLNKNIEILIQTFSPFSNLKGAEKYLDLS